ncbi:MAG: hypothetical protein ACQEUM_07015 [Pseudomonadota bacterium]
MTEYAERDIDSDEMLGESAHAAGSFALAALCWAVTYWQPGEEDHD